ncbi:iron ABC transporter permease [Parapedobacter sp. ISTM3]|uniref:Iron complex transport system permease protein n=1 Tax=Parapedobacter luteus TaxID=623280 RepID=A0A1T5A543_9SPHI|nr:MULTISPECIES: iron ABC transporter permease [Parapedobacter]MBK1440170.1 iron ABC transporter permease [Parapedobacter sp. ISTM3]SKB29753.1 iron complex transport system permease protein [Parapedobacter luteus]
MSTTTTAIEQGYRKQFARRIILLVALALATALSFFFDMVVGPSMLSVSEVFQAIFSPGAVELSSKVIVWEVRMPYSIMALLVGASLSLAGCEMQTIMNNAMASPFTLGVSAAASFGAALAIIIGVSLPGVAGDWMVIVNAFVFAFGATLLLQALSSTRGAGPEGLVLFGIALVFTFNAFTGIMQYMASAEALQQFIFWSLGSLTKANWDNIPLLFLLFVVIVPFSLAAAWPLTALRLGEDSARSFGVSVRRLRFLSLLRISLLTAGSVAFVGTIGFIGLVGPHIAKLLIGEDHRFSLPASILSGALIMSLASLASKAIVAGAIIPVGIVTSLIGVPVFIALILNKRKR